MIELNCAVLIHPKIKIYVFILLIDQANSENLFCLMAANDNQLRRVKSDRCEGSLAERHLEHYLKIVIHVKAVELPIIQSKEQMSIIVGTEPN